MSARLRDLRKGQFGTHSVLKDGRFYVLEDTPLSYDKPAFIFVGSRSGFFHPGVSISQHSLVLDIACMTPENIYILLTKRPENLAASIAKCNIWPLPNIWVGVSVSTQEDADKLIPQLLKIEAAKHIVSVEPMLEYIDLTHLTIKKSDAPDRGKPNVTINALRGWHDVADLRTAALDWVICGAESGSRRRRCDIDHVRDLRYQCLENYVPFFLKQMEVDGKMIKMPMLDGQVWKQYPALNAGNKEMP